LPLIGVLLKHPVPTILSVWTNVLQQRLRLLLTKNQWHTSSLLRAPDEWRPSLWWDRSACSSMYRACSIKTPSSSAMVPMRS